MRDKNYNEDWIKIIGKISLLIGFIGIISSAQLIHSPEKFENQNVVARQFNKKIPDSNSQYTLPEIHINNQYINWSKYGGFLGILINLFYVISSIFLHSNNIIKFNSFYIASALKILYSLINDRIINETLATSGNNLLTTGNSLISDINLIFYIILLLITLLGQKFNLFKDGKK
ncbi:hypothetical protein [Leptospira kanakyensis]|uniref:Uncharacterized protein n=1 Tax=Leptospira kanakyensis TaxID=2484968 RepID=A0A6N4QE63_9LEPT|nr:hypothetical protein [Leptospira kanakyensis]TGK51129.1 hypothetical protein EHQ11_09025 [Leptospira kanakyensis]TGK70619.1 hypothetical protein EHQ18_09215 [Leptospira kanakyensis]